MISNKHMIALRLEIRDLTVRIAKLERENKVYVSRESQMWDGVIGYGYQSDVADSVSVSTAIKLLMKHCRLKLEYIPGKTAGAKVESTAPIKYKRTLWEKLCRR